MSEQANESEYEARLAMTRAKLDDWEVEGLLITNAANRRWLSGFTGSAGQLLITRDQAILATDSRYWEQVKQQATHFTLFRHQRRPEDQPRFIAMAGAGRIGLEAKHVTLAQAADLAKIDGVTWVHLSETLEPFRQVKDDGELAAIRAAAAITDGVMSQVNRLARPGISEKALAWELEKAMRENGADGLAFPIIVASGPNSALPHHHPGERELQEGDAIIVDMGAEVSGYMSDLTRTFFLGDEPNEKFRQIYGHVLAAQAKVMAEARAGMKSGQIDALARDLIAAAGYREQFGHGLGHSLGLEIHESPALTHRPPAAEKTIAPGMILTVEPGIYLPGWGGVRIEDLVQFTADGLRSISHCPKTPVIALSS